MTSSKHTRYIHLHKISFLIFFVLVFQSCDYNSTTKSNSNNNEQELLISGSEFNKVKVKFTGANHEYVKAFRQSSELKSYSQKVTVSNESLNIDWGNSILLNPTEKPANKLLMIPVEPIDNQILSYFFIFIKEGLQLSDKGLLKTKDSIFYGTDKPSFKNGSSGAVFLPMIFQQRRNVQKNKVAYRQGTIKRMEDNKTIISLRKYSDGTLENLNPSSYSVNKAGCDSFYDCVSSTLAEFTDDMGWLYESVAESACGACLWSRGGLVPACATCGGLVGVPIVEFSAICAIDNDLGIGC